MQDNEPGPGTAIAVYGLIILIIGGFTLSTTLLLRGVLDMLRSLCCCTP